MSAYLEDTDLGYKKFKKNVEETHDFESAIGIHEDAGLNENGDDILSYAIWNHFGTENIPERRFVDITADKHKNWQKEIDLAIDEFIYKNKPLIPEIEKVSEVAVKNMQAVINNKEVPPPNKESTIKRKGFDHPLVETGALVNSIDYKIKKI